MLPYYNLLLFVNFLRLSTVQRRVRLNSVNGNFPASPPYRDPKSRRRTWCTVHSNLTRESPWVGINSCHDYFSARINLILTGLIHCFQAYSSKCHPKSSKGQIDLLSVNVDDILLNLPILHTHIQFPFFFFVLSTTPIHWFLTPRRARAVSMAFL